AEKTRRKREETCGQMDDWVMVKSQESLVTLAIGERGVVVSTKERIIEAVRGMAEGVSFDEILAHLASIRRQEADGLAWKGDLEAMAADPQIQAELYCLGL